MWMTKEEIYRLTKRKKFTAQCKALDRLGIKYRRADDGEPLVPREVGEGKAAGARKGHLRWHLINT
jgi:hypothetical protein